MDPELKKLLDDLGITFAEFKTAVRKDVDALMAAKHATPEQIAQVTKRIDGLESEMKNPAGASRSQDDRSIGEMLASHDEVKALASRWTKATAGLQLIERTLFPRSLKTLIDSTAVGSSTPGILVPERVGTIVKPPMRRIRVRDLIPFGTTVNNAVEFVQENTFTNAASPQTEGSDKAESALTFTISHAHVQTIAHWIPATRQILEDFAALAAYVNTRLLDGLADIEDTELLRGSGVGAHLNGLATQATAYAGTYAAAGDTYIDKLNNAITELEDAEYMADGIVLHPADWRTILKVKTDNGGANTGAYIMGGPASNAEARLWDLPVARTTAMQKGKFLVGQFQGSVQGYDRMQSTVDVSNSHSDYFVKNKVAIRAEERITIAVFRPAAFRYGSF